jgi:hypothetical protein
MDSFIQHFNMYHVLFSYHFILYTQVHIVAMYSFVPLSGKSKFCGVSSSVFDKLVRDAGEKVLLYICLVQEFNPETFEYEAKILTTVGR